MIHRNKILLSLALMAAAMAAHADIGPKDLEVKGTIRTPVCSVVQSGGGVYNYETMSLAILPQSGHVKLAEKTQRWGVNCGEGKTFVSFQVQDNRSGTASSATADAMGLGGMEGRPNSKIGYYTINLSNPQVDGEDKTIAVPHADGTMLQKRSYDVTPGWYTGYYSWGSSATDTSWVWINSFLQAGSNFEMDVTVKPFLASKAVVGDGEGIGGKVELDGLAVFVYSFGL